MPYIDISQLSSLYCAGLYPADSIEKENVATYLKTLLED